MHPHRKKNPERRKLARRARQAWKNYAILEGYKYIIDNNWVTLIRSRDGVVHKSSRINVTMSPARVIENPEILAWFMDVDQMAKERSAQDAADAIKYLAANRFKRKYDEAAGC